MATNSLPDDVLLMVLDYVIFLSEDNASQWREQTEYLAVCSQWRRLALRVLSRRAVLVHRDSKDPSTVQCGSWLSNIPLIESTQCTAMIRCVVIEVSLSAKPLHALTSMAGMLGSGNQPWRNARSLKVIVKHESSTPVWRQHDGGRADPEFQGIATWVVRGMITHMPHLSKLQVMGTSGHDASDLFLQLLTGGFANKLDGYSGYASALSRTTDMAAQLTSLSVSFDEHAGETLPHINAEALRSLTLTDLPTDSLWAQFGTSASSSIRFHNLESLALVYLAKNDYNMHANSEQRPVDYPELHFPSLRKLEIENCPADSPMLSAHTNPKLLRDVTITDVSGRVEPGRLVGCNMDVLTVTSYSPRTRDAVFCHATNELFGDKRLAKNSSLTLGFSASIPDPALVRWSGLEKLSVFASVRSDILLCLVAKLPCLAELVVGGNVTHDHPPTSHQPFSGHPISTSLRSFYFGDVYLTRAQGTTELLKQIVLNVPSLADLAFSHKHLDELVAFVNANCAHHPRLARIHYHVLY